jgi:Tol biopolymer transport system component
MRLEIGVPDKINPGLFSLSPDGRVLAFVGAGSDGVRRIWIRRLDSLEAQLLRGTEGAGTPGPFWSPDSRFIAFDGGGSLKKVDISGGPPQRICDLSGNAIGGSWNTDGAIIFGTSGPVMRVPAAGGVAVPITTLDESRKEDRHILPVFLPDGRHFLYLRVSSAMENSGIYVGSLDSKITEQRTSPLVATTYGVGYAPSADLRLGNVLFLREQTLMTQKFDLRRLELTGDPAPVAQSVGSAINRGFFSASVNGVLIYRAGPVSGGYTSQLTWLDDHGTRLGTVWEPVQLINFALAPDASRVAITRLNLQTVNRDVWIIDLARGTPTRFTFGLGTSGNPVWSPDKTRIAFNSSRDGGANLYQKLTSMVKDEEILLKSPELKTPTSWSHDSRFLLYTAVDPKRRNDVWVLPLDGDRKPVPLITSEFNESDGHFSPDDHFVAYVSDDSGHNEIYVRAFSGASVGEKWHVSKDGGTNPRWRGDGKALFYSAADGSVMQVDIKTNPTFQPETPRALFKLPPGSTGLDVTSDGKRFLAAVPVEQDASIPFTIMLNWQAGLSK